MPDSYGRVQRVDGILLPKDGHYVSEGNIVQMQFITNGDIQGKGFEISYDIGNAEYGN